MASDPLRIGLVGYGFGGRYFHAPLISSTAGCQLAGVVTRSPARQTELAADHPGVPHRESVDALVASGVDAVVISTPAATHSEITDDLVRRGVPVVCDKPFALDAAAAARTVELAEAEGVLLTAYQNRRWDSDFLTVKEILGTAALGSLVRFESSFERWSSDPTPPVSGGGLLRDFGSHLVDQALVLFGPARRVTARSHLVGPEVEDDFVLAIDHEAGVVSRLSGAWRHGAPGPRFRLAGTAGAFVVDAPMDGQEGALTAGRSPQTEGDHWGEEPPSSWGHLRQGDRVEPVPSQRGRWDLFYTEFALALRGEGPAPVDPRDAVATAAVLDAARRSAEERRDVDVAATS
jgi:predicted dehydrogenase